MKNNIIVNPPRVGKTTLSKLIVNQTSFYRFINMAVIRKDIYKSIYINNPKEEQIFYLDNSLNSDCLQDYVNSIKCV